ncbi:MAG: IS1 family transposase [Anaerolineae bacterium]|nr:IS1 family transposase [Anaerolineae bacterium]NPV67561.1 IS1 family transposase [Anaerolineae bacterium]
MSQCPYCHRTEQQVKAGLNASGSQRYLCKACRRKYTPQPNDIGYPAEIRRQALEMYVDGLNFRRIARLLKVNHQTVANWVKAHADQLPDPPPAPAEPIEVEELDELFTFVERKKTSST